MADVTAIRARIKANIEASTTGLFVDAVMPTTPPANLPRAIIAPAPGTVLTEVTMDGVEDLELVVIFLAQNVSDVAAQGTADAYLSEATNLANAIDSGSTADWDFCQTGPARNYGGFTFGAGDGAVQYLGFEIPVTVGVS